MDLVKMCRVRKRRYAFCILNITIFLLVVITLSFQLNSETNKTLKYELPEDSINIGTAACSISGDTTFTETVTFIKSILVSAKVYQVRRKVNIYLFVDTTMRSLIKDEISNFRNSVGSEVNFSVYVSNITDLDDQGKSPLFPTFELPCTFVRLLFPILLNLDKILYLDIDTIATGNIEKIWDKVSAGDKVMAGLVPNSMPGDAYEKPIYEPLFGRFRHVPPRGVNAGVMFMHLNNMRQFNWTQKIITMYHREPFILNNDQILINGIFHDNLDNLTILPCNYNFMHVLCERGWTCSGKMWESSGIQIFHGAGNKFQESGGTHRRMFDAYKQINVNESRDQLIQQLLELKKSYSVIHASTCGGQIGQQLFVDI